MYVITMFTKYIFLYTYRLLSVQIAYFLRGWCSFFFFISFLLFFILLQFLITRCCGALNSISLHTLRTLLALHTENIVNKARMVLHKRTHAYASWHKSFSLYALHTWHSFTLFWWHSAAYLWFISIPFNFTAFAQVHAACTMYMCVRVRVWFRTYDNTFDLFLRLIEVQHFSL